MRIGEVAARSGVSVRALRYYEEQNLLTSERSSSGQRHYEGGAIERVRLIQLLFSAGLPSKTIVRVLPCVDTGHATGDMLDMLAGERDRIQTQISQLQDAHAKLESVMSVAQASRGDEETGRARDAQCEYDSGNERDAA